MLNPILLPLAAIQGRRLHSRIPVLTEPSGPSTGVAGPDTAEPIRLVVVGESTAAGYGAATHSEAFAAHLAGQLAGRLGRGVAWEAIGHHGATARRIRYKLVPRVPFEIDIAVLLAGTNDVLAGRRAAEWEEDLHVILQGLEARSDWVIVPAIPPFGSMTIIPRALRQVLSARAASLDEVAARLCGASSTALWIDADRETVLSERFFSDDGFHPSSEGYADWARAVASRIA